jgi:hypothetical protein
MAVRSVVGALATAAVAAGLLVCGSAQAYTVKQTDSGATVRWHTNLVTLRMDPSMEAYFDAEMQVTNLVRQSAHAWRGLEGVPDLQLSEGEPGPKGFDPDRGITNGVYLIEDWELADSSLAVTVATFESRTGKIVDTDILVNANHAFGVMPDGPDQKGKAFDLRGVMTHEMGHVLGLGESFDVRMATMWPNIARGETHQRDISIDDEDGAELAYSFAPLAGIEPVGCGGSSVVLHRSKNQSASFWLVSGGLLIGAGLWLRSRARRGRSRGVPALALVLLFGAPAVGTKSEDASESERVEVVRTLALRRLPFEARRVELAKRLGSPSRKVRMAAAAVLERVGAREDQALAAKLSTDADPEVRRMALVAYETLRTAPPAARLRMDDPEAQERLARLLGGAKELVSGQAIAVGVSQRNGLFWSKYQVQAKDRVVEVEIPGGTLGEYTQVVSEEEPPADGETVIVALREGTKPAWAHLREGVVYGGYLGEGPGIEWTR